MSTLTIQPSDIDTILQSNAPDTNYGTSASIDVLSNSTPYNHRSILKFDFSVLPGGATISAATLSLYLYGKSGTVTGRTYWAYELTQTGWTETGATWNRYDGGNTWAAAGGDYTTTNGASATVPAINNWIDWDVLALVQHFQSAHTEVAHFLMRDGTEGEGDTTGYFFSNNYTTDLTLRPKLVVTYTTSSIKTINGLAKASVKTINGLAIASVKTWNGLA